jgi:hypothetical protein
MKFDEQWRQISIIFRRCIYLVRKVHAWRHVFGHSASICSSVTRVWETERTLSSKMKQFPAEHTHSLQCSHLLGRWAPAAPLSVPSKSIQICQIESFLQSKLKRALPHWYLVLGIWQVRFFCRLVLSVSSEILLHLPFGYMWSIYIRHRASQWGTCGLFFTLLCSITPMLGFKNLLKNPLRLKTG